MHPLADRMRRMKPSASIAAKAKVLELQAAGHRILDLTAGEPDLSTPDHIIEAAIKAMRAGDTHYVSALGTSALRNAVVAKYAREDQLAFTPGEIIVGSGAKQLIFGALAATVEAGVEVVIPAPYWVSYPDMVAYHGGTPVIVGADPANDFKLSAAALEAAITSATRWVIINFPNNPAGTIYSEADLAALATVLRAHPHVWIMTDDIYEHLIYDGVHSPNLLRVAPDLRDRTLLVNGVSKAYAMTGWRIGYAAGPKPFIEAIGKLIGQTTTCASSVAQAAAVEALTGDQSFVAEARALFERRRNLMLDLLGKVPGLTYIRPSGAFYVYLCVESVIGKTTPSGTRLNTDSDVMLYLLEAARVAVLDGTPYGLSPYLRLSFATSEDVITEACNAISAAFAQLS